jgi:enoyl-CoA hydratase/carnithine racemase
MNYTAILYTVTEGICHIELNRPDVLNALSPQLVVELKNAFEVAAKDESVGVIILSGAGRAFSAGVDLKEMNQSIQGGKFSQDEILKAGLEMIENIQTMPKVCIAIVHGFCFTGALELALAFDLMYVADDTKLGDTHAKWGILPKWGMSQRLPQKVGIMKAREMSFTAQTISGKEAEQYGMANKSVPATELKDYVFNIAKTILCNSRQAVAAFKHLYHEGSHTTLKEGLKMESAFNTDITDRTDFLRQFVKNK